MQSRQMYVVTRYFPLYSCPMNLTDNLVFVWDESWINRLAIGDVEITLPLSHDRP